MKIGSESLPSSISVNHNIRNLEFLPKAISTFQQDYYDTMCLTLHHHRILIISAWEFPRNSLLGNFSRGLFKRLVDEFTTEEKRMRKFHPKFWWKLCKPLFWRENWNFLWNSYQKSELLKKWRENSNFLKIDAKNQTT